MTNFVGGMGNFDAICASTLLEIKAENKDKAIRLILVLPYMKQSINTYGHILNAQYDEILIPSECNGRHVKQAITQRNRWMIGQSQYLIAYVGKDYGGAYTMMRYARKKGLHIENLF